MKEIQLTKGKAVKVDDDDYERLVKYKWQYGGRRYAIRNVHIKDKNGKRKTKVIWMHREILKTPKGFLTDHINGDALDNRKENLRIVTHQQNVWNMEKPSHNTSGYKGVHKRGNRWEASIHLNNKKKHLGYFPSAEDAAKMYNKAAKEYFMEYARLNNINIFEFEYFPTIESLLNQISKCESIHTQQAIFSTFHHGLTQVCFGCKKVRSSIKR